MQPLPDDRRRSCIQTLEALASLVVRHTEALQYSQTSKLCVEEYVS